MTFSTRRSPTKESTPPTAIRLAAAPRGIKIAPHLRLTHGPPTGHQTARWLPLARLDEKSQEVVGGRRNEYQRLLKKGSPRWRACRAAPASRELLGADFSLHPVQRPNQLVHRGESGPDTYSDPFHTCTLGEGPPGQQGATHAFNCCHRWRVRLAGQGCNLLRSRRPPPPGELLQRRGKPTVCRPGSRRNDFWTQLGRLQVGLTGCGYAQRPRS